MQKIISHTLSIALVAVGITSCAKTTKGKVTHEWKVVSYSKNDSFTNQGGQSGTTNTHMTETTYTQDFTSSNGGMTVSNNSSGAVNAHEISLKKDGTWSLIEDLVTNQGNSSTRNVTEQTGTWTFVGKTKGDNFKKNERLLLNVLAHKRTSTYTVNQLVVNQYEQNDTYLTGENVLIYTIKSSGTKELELELVNDVVIHSDYGSSPGTNTDKLTINMTLKQK